MKKIEHYKATRKIDLTTNATHLHEEGRRRSNMNISRERAREPHQIPAHDRRSWLYIYKCGREPCRSTSEQPMESSPHIRINSPKLQPPSPQFCRSTPAFAYVGLQNRGSVG